MIGALWAGIRFLKGFDIFSRNAVYYAAYDQVDGVQNASPILMPGREGGSRDGYFVRLLRSVTRSCFN